MRRTIIATLVVVMMSAAVASADLPASKASISLPTRPIALTTGQYQALQAIQATPEHRAVLSTTATYSTREESLEFTRFSDDFWTATYDVCWPGSYLAILICAL